MKKEDKKEIKAKEHNHQSHSNDMCDCGHDCGCC